MKHKLTNIDTDTRTADCSNCGKITVYSAYYKKSNTFRWNCGGKLTTDVSRKTHLLTDICTKTKTAYCSDCGVATIFSRKQKGGAIYWACLKGMPGKEDRKKAKLRTLRKNYCEECGFQSEILAQIDTHHIDENHDNDDPSNTISLCKNCHALKHVKTYEELDKERIDKITYLRNNCAHLPETIIKPGHKNTAKYSHVLSDICGKSRTGYCKRCGLVSVVIRKDKSGFQYWQCNHGGKRATYGKNGSKRAKLQQFYRDLKKGYCEKCGFVAVHDTQLDIHHKDHNHQNNDVDNLICYCKLCHCAEHQISEEDMKIEREIKALSKRWEYLINN